MSVETTRAMLRELLKAVEDLLEYTDGLEIEMPCGKEVIKTTITLSTTAPPGVEKRLPGVEVARDYLAPDEEKTDPGFGKSGK